MMFKMEIKTRLAMAMRATKVMRTMTTRNGTNSYLGVMTMRTAKMTETRGEMMMMIALTRRRHRRVG